MNTLAQRIHRFGGPDVIELESIELPQPGPGEVLVRIVAAGVGPWDAWIRAGKSALPQPLPLTLGADIAGMVLETGPDASHIAAGVEVYGVTNARFVGGYATHAIVEINRVARKPPGISFIDAAGLPVVGVTAWKALFERGQLAAGQRVLIHGASGNVGRLAVQMAHNVQATVVAAGATESADVLRRLGADTVVDYAQPFESRFDPVDLVIDTIGGDIQNRSLSTLKSGGRLVSIVNPPDVERARELGVDAQFFVVDVTAPDIDRLSQLLIRRTISPNESDVLAFTEARAAHILLESTNRTKRGKIVLSMERAIT